MIRTHVSTMCIAHLNIIVTGTPGKWDTYDFNSNVYETQEAAKIAAKKFAEQFSFGYLENGFGIDRVVTVVLVGATYCCAESTAKKTTLKGVGYSDKKEAKKAAREHAKQHNLCFTSKIAGGTLEYC